MSPKAIVSLLSKEYGSTLDEISNALFEMSDDGAVEITPDKKFKRREDAESE